MMKMMILLMVLGLCGCTSVTAQNGDFKVSRTAFGSNLSVSKLTVKSESDGSFSIAMAGAISEPAQVMDQAMQLLQVAR